MESKAPRRDLIRFVAQFPYAAEPPDFVISPTMIPSMTRKIKIPRFHGSPTYSVITWKIDSSVRTILKLVKSSAPAMIPINKEEYTSLVISAKTIAIRGGSSAKGVP